jgi:hypothetical protein
VLDKGDCKPSRSRKVAELELVRTLPDLSPYLKDLYERVARTLQISPSYVAQVALG